MTTLNPEAPQTAAGAALLRELERRSEDLAGWISGPLADDAAAADTVADATRQLGLPAEVIGDPEFTRRSIAAAWHAGRAHAEPAAGDAGA